MTAAAVDIAPSIESLALQIADAMRRYPLAGPARDDIAASVDLLIDRLRSDWIYFLKIHDKEVRP